MCGNSVSVVRQRIAHVGFDPSSAAVFKFFATFREEPDSEEGSSADEGVPRGAASRRGMRDSTTVGVGRTIFEIWDGQTLASPGRWRVAGRRWADSSDWMCVVLQLRDFAKKEGMPELLIKLALGKVHECSLFLGASRFWRQDSLTD